MDSSLQKYYSQPENFTQLVWDYNLEPADFFAILNGEKSKDNFDQNWAIARIFQNLNYYDAINLVPISVLNNHWDKVKRQLYPESFRKAYEFVLQKHSLSTSRQNSENR